MKDTFYKLYMDNKIGVEYLEIFIREWNNSTTTKTLDEFLDMPKKVYDNWVQIGLIDVFIK